MASSILYRSSSVSNSSASNFMMIFLTLVLVLFGMLRRTQAPEPVQTRLGAVLLITCIQAAIGYIQYFNGVPPGLVIIHVFGSVVVWIAALAFDLSLIARPVEAERTDEFVATS